MSDDADSPADDAGAPIAASERIVALDVLRGFALLGIFIMNMPAFSHSIFAAPQPPRGAVDTIVAVLREWLFAGKFNLLFGVVFGVGFALQTARLDAFAAARARRGDAAFAGHGTTATYARRMAFLLVVGAVHAMLLWPGDVLLVYALLGFALLAGRRLGDGPLLGLLAACLVFPALVEALAPLLFAPGAETLAAFEYQQLRASNDAAFGHGSFADAVRETARVFAWTSRSPFGQYAYATAFVQMATGILAGFIAGRRGWLTRRRDDTASSRGAAAPAGGLTAGRALVVAVVCGAVEFAALATGAGGGAVVATLARTLGRAALAACYALAIVRFVARRRELPRWLGPLAAAGRMPLTNYLLQTALACFIFYGWGLGRWNSVGPAGETALAVLLFVAVQLPFSAAWMARHRQGPLEGLWRWFTYGLRKA